ncbi:MAG: sensor domain-containing diguanylate cyclase [Burkholderiales bacterium]
MALGNETRTDGNPDQPMLLSREDAEELIRFQGSILEAVAFGSGEKEIVDRVCRLGEAMVPGSIATVMLLDDTNRLNVHAAPSASPEIAARLNGLCPGPESGSCGNAVYRQEPVFVANIPADSRWNGLRSLAEEFSLGSCWSLPIFSGERKVVGTFALTGFENRMPSSFQKRLMEIAASIITIMFERRKQTDALRQSEERFRLLFEEASDPKMLVSEEGRILDVNRMTYERLGYTWEEMVGRPVSDFVSPENADKIAGRLKRVRLEGRATYESAQMHKNGTVMPVEISTIAIELDGKRTFYSILRDISRRKEMESALRESEAHLRGILENAPIGLATASPQGRFTKVNQSLCEILGYEAGELEKLTFQEITHPDDLPANLDNYRRLLAGEISSYTMEKRYIKKDGSTAWAQLTTSLLRDAIGKPLHFIAQIEDISERIRTREQLHHLAYYDTLTDLPNRRFLLEKLDWALTQARRHDRSLAVMFLDLDRFKQVNDDLGHDVGDELLKEVAARLSACVRKGDIVSRQGGDEFIIALTEISHPEDAVLVAEKIIESMGVPIKIGPHRIAIGISIGIALHPAGGDDDMRKLMKKADRAMYAAKDSGSTGYRLFSE